VLLAVPILHGSNKTILLISSEAIMDLIEIVHLRAYSEPDRDAAVAAFHQLTPPDRQKGIRDMILFKEIDVASDLCIFIHRRGEGSRKGKSSLGLQMASAFSEFGQIDHTVWSHECSIRRKARRNHHEKER
jgi:hypothetical protein